MLINLAQIRVDPRLRHEENEKFNELVQSIQEHGLLQPIIVSDQGDGVYKLEAGEQRLKAVTVLSIRGEKIRYGQDWIPEGQIEAQIKGKLTPMVSLMIEFEENERRKDFNYIEKAAYVRKLHEMLVEFNKGRWSQEMTAEALNLSTGSISYYLNLTETIEEHPEVGKAATMSAAIKRSKVVKQIELRKTAVMKDESPILARAKSMIWHGKAEEWMFQFQENSVDLFHLDPPWGDNVSSKVQENWEGFDDSTEYSTPLIEFLLKESFRALKPNRFCIFWYRAWAYREMLDLATKAGFSVKFTRTPCIWYKPDKTSDQMRFPEKQLIDAYETFFLLRKGDAVFYEREVQNVFVEPRVPRSQLTHPTEKPVSLMERLIKLTSVPGELIVDPTAGSGSFLHAGWNVKRRIMGCELSKDYYERVVLRLTEAMK